MSGTRGPGQSARTEAIVSELRRRYPCQAIPTGGLTEIAAQFGVTREWVRQVANRNGWDGRLRKKDQVRTCKECPDPPHKKGAIYCVEHKDIPLACGECGTVFRIDRHDLKVRLAGLSVGGERQGRKEGQFYCSRRCYGAVWGRANGRGRQAVAS